MLVRFGVMLGSVATTAGVIGLLQSWLGFAPLILMVAPIAVCLESARIGLALIAAASAAVIGDYLFVEPVGEITVHAQGLRLLVLFILGTGLMWLVRRPIPGSRH